MHQTPSMESSAAKRFRSASRCSSLPAKYPARSSTYDPTTGSHPGVLIWPDAFGLRPSMRDIGKRVAAEGYSVLVPNPFYRVGKAPMFADASSFNFGNPADITALEKIAKGRGLKLIFDAAHGFGAQHQGVPVGPQGDAQVYKRLPSGNHGRVVLCSGDEEVWEGRIPCRGGSDFSRPEQPHLP